MTDMTQDHQSTEQSGAAGYGLSGSYGMADVDDYVALLKPRVMSLVIFTALVGFLVAPGTIHPILGLASILCIAIGAGASAALNMWYDADIDAVMKRTAARPIPAGKISPGNALGLGLVLSVLSVMVLWLSAGVAAAALLALTIFFYAVIYTMWLKRRTPQNIVIGGAAGAFPPMIGWAAATNSVTVDSLILFAIIFMWTPPHFWALSLFVGKDYDRAEVPMLPQVSGERATRTQAFWYSVALVPVTVAPVFTGLASAVYGIWAAALGLRFLQLAWHVLNKRDAADKKLFVFSIFYLFAIFGGLALDVVIGGWING